MNSLLLARLEPCILPQSIGHDKVPTFFWGPLFGPGVVRKIWKVASLRDNENLCATQRPPLIFLHDLDPDGCMVADRIRIRTNKFWKPGCRQRQGTDLVLDDVPAKKWSFLRWWGVFNWQGPFNGCKYQEKHKIVICYYDITKLCFALFPKYPAMIHNPPNWQISNWYCKYQEMMIFQYRFHISRCDAEVFYRDCNMIIAWLNLG